MEAFNMNKALEMVDGDREFLRELIDLFLADYPEKLIQIQDAIQRRDLKVIQENAHSLKGAAGNLGLTEIYEASLAMERLAREGKIENMEKIFTELHKSLKNFRDIAHDMI